MTLLRTILIFGILIFLVSIWFLLTNSEIDDVQTPVDQVDSQQIGQDINNQQDYTPILNPSAREFEFREFAETPDGYAVERIPSSGLVNSVISSNPSNSFEQVLSELYLDTFLQFECVVPGRPSERALMVTTRPDQNGNDTTARQAVLQWEPFMARDVGVALYPNLQDSDFNDTILDFSDVGNDQLAAQFTVNGSARSIYYGWVLNFVVFATSKNCLTTAINDIYAPQSH